MGIIQTKSPFDMFDGILVINIDRHLDRWMKFQEEANAYGFNKKVHRVKGEKFTKAPYGCALAHKKCLEYAREKRWANVLILEDDVKFLYSVSYLRKIMKAVAEDKRIIAGDWDVLYLGISARGNLSKKKDELTPGNLIQSRGKWYGRFAYAVNSNKYDIYDGLPSEDMFQNKHRGDVVLAGRKDLRKLVVWPALASVTDSPSLNDPYLTDIEYFIESRYVKFNLVDKANVIMNKFEGFRIKRKR